MRFQRRDRVRGVSGNTDEADGAAEAEGPVAGAVAVAEDPGDGRTGAAAAAGRGPGARPSTASRCGYTGENSPYPAAATHRTLTAMDTVASVWRGPYRCRGAGRARTSQTQRSVPPARS